MSLMPEKAVNQVPRPVREQYQKGVTALQRQNFDYAVAILTQILDQEPAFYDCREALRAAQSKKNGSGGGFFKRMISGASSSPMVAKGQIALRSDPQEALKIAEQILNSDPNSSAAHKILAEAARVLDFPKTALLSLSILAKNNPKDTDIQRQLAGTYADLGQGDKAEAIYTQLIQNNPQDISLLEEYKNISARKTLDEGGYEAMAESGGSYRDVLKDKEQAISLEQEQKQVKTEDMSARLIREYESRLEMDPSNVKLIRSIGELYVQKNDFDKALEYFNRLIQASGPADATLRKLIADTTLKKLDYLLSQLDPQLPDYAEQAAQIKAQRDAYSIEECKLRAEAYPNDLQIRFELGVLYFNANKISEAIQEFQKAQSNPNRRVYALGYLGQCFSRRGMNDLAVRKLQEALKEKPGFDDEKKELIYALGLVFEKMGKKEEAIEQFKQIYETDIGFKDVAAKVDAYYSHQG
jgi:tetratricopeptide (TPR) repeat protein